MSVELGTVAFWERLKEDPKRLAAEVASVDLVNLQVTLQQHSGLRAWIAAAFEQARVEEERVQFRLTQARARALLKAKEVEDPHTEKPKTVSVLQAEVDIDPAVVQLQDDLFVIQDKRGGLRAMNTALDDRLQMLIQISSNQRAERHS